MSIAPCLDKVNDTEKSEQRQERSASVFGLAARQLLPDFLRGNCGITNLTNGVLFDNNTMMEGGQDDDV